MDLCEPCLDRDVEKAGWMFMTGFLVAQLLSKGLLVGITETKYQQKTKEKVCCGERHTQHLPNSLYCSVLSAQLERKSILRNWKRILLRITIWVRELASAKILQRHRHTNLLPYDCCYSILATYVFLGHGNINVHKVESCSEELTVQRESQSFNINTHAVLIEGLG